MMDFSLSLLCLPPPHLLLFSVRRKRGTSKVIRDTMLKLLGTVTANPSGASILNNTHFSDARLLYSQRAGITVEVKGCKEVPEIPFSDFYSGAVTAFDERGLELPVKKYSKLIGRKYAANTPLIKKLLEEVEGDQCGAVQSIVAAAQSARLLEQTDEHKVRSKQSRTRPPSASRHGMRVFRRR